MSAIPADAVNQSRIRQAQFLDVITRDEATARFHHHLKLAPLGRERVTLAAALNRVLARSVVAPIDVPGFDRSNVDGFAVLASDSYGAMEESPRRLRLNAEVLSPGVRPQQNVASGIATPIATGAMLPRGADAVVMVEHTDVAEEADGHWLELRGSVAPGQNVSFAGTDVARGETVMREGQRLTSREIGVLAALGLTEIEVYRKPRVAIISTGDEIIAPGEPYYTGAVYDSNAAIVGAAVSELGGEPVPLGVFRDDEQALSKAVAQGMDCDMIILSGGTSKGAGDLSYRVVSTLDGPGIVAHGVALKPGKPICLAVSKGKPVVILPGFPTSAIFTFHEFVAPVIRAFAGQPAEQRETVSAGLPMRINSERGRTEYLLVNLVAGEEGLMAYPMGKGSGSVTTFSHADGFVAIDQHTELVEPGQPIAVQLLGHRLEPADLVAIGSHCVGLDWLLGELQRHGIFTKAMHVGSNGGLAAARRGECDIAGIHLMDPSTGEYNQPFVGEGLTLLRGYGRMQGVVFRADDPRFAGADLSAIGARLGESGITMVNRNAGSGTRILIDRLLQGAQPSGYGIQAKSHNAVATAVLQGRADWGVAIDTVAKQYGLGFVPLQEERYDFVIPEHRRDRPAVRQFAQLLQSPLAQNALRDLGFIVD